MHTPAVCFWPTRIRAGIYVPRMRDGGLTRSYGTVFNEIAAEYDRNRPAYPDALVDHACRVAGLGVGDRVLEVGCGTGQLTRSLLARGLRVTALDPGDQLVTIAREKLKDAGDVEFVNARLEDMHLPRRRYQAVFSASAIHWTDPDLSWRKIADVLADDGTLALLQYLGLHEPRSADDQEDLLCTLRMHAPEIAADWPIYRDLESTIAGVRDRRGNVADAWGWLGSYDIGRGYAADLFEDVEFATLPMLIEHTADELGALLATMSFWARLAPDQRDAVAGENRALHERLGRPIRSSTLAALVTAGRRGRIAGDSSRSGWPAADRPGRRAKDSGLGGPAARRAPVSTPAPIDVWAKDPFGRLAASSTRRQPSTSEESRQEMQRSMVMRISGASSVRRATPALRRAALTLFLAALVLGSASAGLASAAHTKSYLYWTNYGVSGSGGTIGRAGLGGHGINESFISGANGPVGIAVHGGFIYWSNPGIDANSPGTTIGRARLNGTDVNQSFITGLNSPHSLAISGGYIYWDSRYGNTIGRAALNGTAVNQNFITGASGPWGVAIAGHYIYWTNYGAGGGSSGTTIGRASLDGTAVNQSFITGASAPAGIAVHKNYIYWSNEGSGQTGTTIGRANLDGTAVNESFITGAHAPAGITVNGGYLYWSNFGSSHGINGSTIGRARLSGAGVTQHFITGAASPAGITTSAG